MLSWFSRKATPDPGPAAVRRFWEWFQGNAPRLLRYQQDRGVLNELHRHLQRVHPELCFEMGVGGEGLNEIIISAGGIREAIPAVETLVAAAPALPGWKLIAFKQPKPGIDVEIEVEGYQLGIDAIQFVPLEEGDLVGLDLYVHDYQSRPEEVNGQFCFIWLDQLLGEYSVMTRIGSIEIHPDPPETVPHARPLRELPALIRQHTH